MNLVENKIAGEALAKLGDCKPASPAEGADGSDPAQP